MLTKSVGTHMHLADYLRELGWKRDADVKGRYEVWIQGKKGRDVIYLPSNPEAADYQAMLQRAWQTLIDSAGDAARLRFVVESGTGTASVLESVEWKAETPNEEGTIPWADGMQLWQAAHIVLTEAARTVSLRGISKTQGRRTHLIQEFLRTTTMAQTRKGSYIVSAQAPRDNVLISTEPEPGSTTLFDDAPKGITSGHILTNLADSITSFRDTLREASRRVGPLTIDESVRAKLTHQLVSTVYDSVAHGALQIKVSRFRAERPLVTTAEFLPSDRSAIERTLSYLAAAPQPSKGMFIGKVELLRRTKGQHIRFRTDVDGKSLLER